MRKEERIKSHQNAGLCVCVWGGLCVSMCVSCRLVLLAKGGTTVGTPPLSQCEAEEDTEGEEKDGTQDPQAGEVILQDTNPATHTIEALNNHSISTIKI